MFSCIRLGTSLSTAKGCQFCLTPPLSKKKNNSLPLFSKKEKKRTLKVQSVKILFLVYLYCFLLPLQQNAMFTMMKNHFTKSSSSSVLLAVNSRLHFRILWKEKVVLTYLLQRNGKQYLPRLFPHSKPH